MSPFLPSWIGFRRPRGILEFPSSLGKRGMAVLLIKWVRRNLTHLKLHLTKNSAPVTQTTSSGTRKPHASNTSNIPVTFQPLCQEAPSQCSWPGWWSLAAPQPFPTVRGDPRPGQQTTPKENLESELICRFVAHDFPSHGIVCTVSIQIIMPSCPSCHVVLASSCHHPFKSPFSKIWYEYEKYEKSWEVNIGSQQQKGGTRTWQHGNMLNRGWWWVSKTPSPDTWVKAVRRNLVFPRRRLNLLDYGKPFGGLVWLNSWCG